MTRLPSLYKARGVPVKSPVCAICVDRTRGKTLERQLTHGVRIWLCPGHHSIEFMRANAGRDFAVTLMRSWRAHGCLTRARARALDAHLHAIKATGSRTNRPRARRHMPGHGCAAKPSTTSPAAVRCSRQSRDSANVTRPAPPPCRASARCAAGSRRAAGSGSLRRRSPSPGLSSPERQLAKFRIAARGLVLRVCDNARDAGPCDDRALLRRIALVLVADAGPGGALRPGAQHRPGPPGGHRVDARHRVRRGLSRLRRRVRPLGAARGLRPTRSTSCATPARPTSSTPGIRRWRSGAEALAEPPEPASPRRIMAQGFVVQLLNPKVAIFFLAYFPQFLDRRRLRYFRRRSPSARSPSRSQPAPTSRTSCSPRCSPTG